MDERSKVQKAILLSKIEEAKQTKNQRAMNINKRAEILHRNNDENRVKQLARKQQAKLAHMKVEEDKRRKLDMARRDHNSKV